MNAVKSYRLAAGLTQEALAKRIQLPLSTISKIENESRRLKADELPRFARALGCAPQDLIPVETTQDELLGNLSPQAAEVSHAPH